MQVARYGVLVGGNECWLVDTDAGWSIRGAGPGWVDTGAVMGLRGPSLVVWQW